ncbi:MAG: hypothetical protein AMJ53_03370 [Gammaproteobacteria bacterium SG8_11]|nr:MAG: hypothetical protein AMJ53_03370 [Gammaproteobacteria bacterium SG8_11]
MQTFIRVTEIWIPTDTGSELELKDGNYDSLEEFGQISGKEKFALGEGLPGKAWELARPLVLKSFDNSYFLRTEIAHKVGLTSAVAIPVFAGERLNAVLVFLCGEQRQPEGAIEIWRDDGLSGLSFIDGYYGELEKFEWISKRIKFPRGRGLPGMVWEKSQPLLMGDLANSNSFLRSQSAAEAGITTGIGLPFYSNQKTEAVDAVITFLSSSGTPIAKRFEVWLPDEETNSLLFEAGIDQGSRVVDKPNPMRFFKKGEGTVGGVWQTGIPAISHDVSHELSICGQDDSNNNYDSLLAIPLFQNSTLNSVVVFYN